MMTIKPVKHRNQYAVLLASVFSIVMMVNDAQAGMSQAEIDRITASWKCQWCPYTYQAVKEGEVEGGFGNVSNDSFKHGRYTGLDNKGVFLVGNGSYEYKDDKSKYLDIDARDIGLDSRQLAIEGGSQGRYDLELRYSMLPSLNIDTARTPYRGESTQRLPAAWVDNASTAGMTQLASSLRDVDIYSERKTIDVGAIYYSSPSLSYDLNFQQQTKEGWKAMGSPFFVSSVILAVPVDTSTKQGSVKVNYRSQNWQGSLGYAFSLFDNSNDSVQWENAYSDNPETGQAALEPDNEMQQITLDGVYLFTDNTQATVSIAAGRMTQDADFLPYATDESIVVPSPPPPLPRASLDGEVNTFNTILRLNSHWNDSWNYLAQYRHNERVNETPRATYNYVITDGALGASRVNFPFSFRERELLLQGKYQIGEKRHITLGYKRKNNDRTYQEVEETNEDIFSAFYRSRINEDLKWSLKLHNSKRVGDEYNPVTGFAPEDALLRKYNLADRNRRMAAASLSYSLTDALQIGVFGDYAYDDYFDSDVGLQESRQSTVSLELQYRMSNDLSMSIDYSATDIDSSQAGTTWDADNEDSVYVAHVGVNYNLTKYKLLLGADLTYANAVGDVTVSTGSGFPKLESTRKTFSLSADYSLDEKSAIHAFFGYEDYEEEDWAIEGVAPNTMNSVLTLGETSPSYDVGVFVISYRTRF